MIAKGNPKGIRGIEDLVRPDIAFINRQSGSGTRILLDYELQKAGIDPRTIPGYRSEEYTHMSIAMAVASHRADVGLGILASAKALDLDFIPIARERYDLVIPDRFFQDHRMQMLLEIIRSRSFAEQVVALGGYEVEETGRISG
jgi:putative molybdopterin biosynthesis protein